MLRTAVDNLYLYDPDFEAGAKSFLSSVGGSSAYFQIKNTSDIKTAIDSYVGVKFLIFDTHGEAGKISLSDHAKVEGLDFMFYMKNNSFLKRDAQILFYGCSIGDGSAGDTFIDEAGFYLLKGKGGIVGATTVTNFTFQSGSWSSESYMNLFGRSRLKVKRFNTQGKATGSRTVDRWGNAQ